MNLAEIDALLAEPDEAVLLDLVTFSRAEVETRDVEPWADLIREIYWQGGLDAEETTWLLTLYNTYDSFSSAWNVFRRWPSPQEWLRSSARDEARRYPIMQERRNLHGGRVNLRHESYAQHVGEGSQAAWYAQPLELDDFGKDFERLNRHVRQITQVGRQAAYELCEFVAKILDIPVDSTDGHLWESSGPRQSIEDLYGVPSPNLSWLNEKAAETKKHLEAEGVPLSWWDFETIICDFKVGRRGRYYVGQHLGALKEEILEIAPGDDQEMLLFAFESIIPDPWSDIPPGIDKSRRPLYRDTGKVLTTPWWT